ncbi:beta-lactamase-like protein [Irpex rosettiformis]|uniref:Beta-lactamase-like protein n=1 Tax=Irpex rosettiformis TaxID=378272 RepID=A0ACB8TVH7_9APHY|nr:beta-lactamase-like protein [Irpex rosettiformis]
MSTNIVVTFLGTTSGGGPIETRNCSSLVVDAIGDGSLWMVDCAEGTVRQFAQQPLSSTQRLKVNSVNRIFITHMHADHSMGLITLLRNILGFAPDPHAPPGFVGSSSNSRPPKPPILKVEIYGPVGLRAFVRTVLTLTHTRSADRYCVNELLMPGGIPSASRDVPEDWHSSEVGGRDILCSDDGFWREIVVQERDRSTPIVVSAGPIVHRDPCIGFVFSEQSPREPESTSNTESQTGPAQNTLDCATIPRTLVILGDTSDPSALIPLIKEDASRSVSLLIHEATDAYIPHHIDSRGTTGSKSRNHETVRTKAIAKGHSTPAMAGAFARQIGAERLALNHIGSRFPAPPPHAGPSNFRHLCMREIEHQATRAWQPINGNRAVAVSDFDRIVIPPVFKSSGDVEGMGGSEVVVAVETTVSLTVLEQLEEVMAEPHSHGPARGRGSSGGRGGWRGGHRQHGQHGHFRSHNRQHQHDSTAGEGSIDRKREHSGRHDSASTTNSSQHIKRPRRGDDQ